MEIISIEAGPLLTNTYIAVDDKTKKSVIIDAPMDSISLLKPMIKKRDLEIEAILLTHTHWDHAADTADLKDEYGADVILHKDDLFRLTEPNEHSVFPLPYEIKSASGDRYVDDGDTVTFGNIDLEVLHTPGHTAGGICFWNKEHKVVFCGDTVFRESVGRVDLPGGSADVLAKAIKEKLLSLDDETKLLPGHGPSTTVGYEKKNNPFFRELGIT